MSRLAPRALGVSRVLLYARFFRYLLWEFRWSVGVFWGLVLVGGLVLWLFYHDSAGLTRGYAESCYAVFMLVFLEPYLEFPREWYLQPFFFIVPVIGLAAVADSLVRLGYLLFTRKQDLPEWHRMVASLYRNHIIVVGVGKVGLRIIRGLLALKEPLVAIERAGENHFLEEVRDCGVPVIVGDGRQRKVLEQAGVMRARSIIVATSDDLSNLDSALTARDVQPGIHVVLRLFDDSLAGKVSGAFAMPVISTAQVAAPAFIAAATGRQVYHEFKLAGQQVYLIDLRIRGDGGLVGRTVGEVQSSLRVNVVMHQGASGVNVNPGHDVSLLAGDMVLVIAPMEQLREFESANAPRGPDIAE
jgi:voltage-gated potassium channel